MNAQTQSVQTIESISQAEELLAAGKPVALKFFATWCGPCKALAPTFEKVADALQDQATFTSLDVEKVSELAQRYQVSAVPTIVVVKSAEDTNPTRITGNQPLDKLQSMIEAAIS